MNNMNNQEGITVKKEENFTEWFTQLMLKAKLADYSKVSGSMVYRPSGYELWERLKQETNKEFGKLGIKNCYFPMFIPESLFKKEKEFVEGFAPEVAWVTHGGNTKLGERLAVRPTSEAIMYDSYSKWIRSWRDLPMLLNQWNNVVRWEFNNPVPFFRAREFLWNELHSVFASEKEALEHGEKVMKAYKKVSEEIMAMPGIYGKKTNSEKFAGAIFSKKVHTYLPNGKISEDACFHYDGQNFAKAYDIKFQDKEGKERYVWQNTHAISIRLLGGMLALHSDNKGLVLPPRIATNKVVIVPVMFEKNKKVLEEAKKIKKKLDFLNPLLDDRLDVRPGWKYNEWELKGIPLRIEIGPRDMEKDSVMIVKRNDSKREQIQISKLKEYAKEKLEEIQDELRDSAKKMLEENMTKTEDKKELSKMLKDKKMVKIPLCNQKKCEDLLKDENAGAKTLFIDETESIKNKKCLFCNKTADYLVYVGKTY